MSDPENKLIEYKAAISDMKSQNVVLSSESKKNFDDLLTETRNRINPGCKVEEELVDQIVYSFWKIRRSREAARLFIEKHCSLVNGGINKRNVDWERIFGGNFMDKLTRYEVSALKQVSTLFDTLVGYRQMNINSGIIEAEISGG